MQILPMTSKAWRRAKTVVEDGGLVAFPTDTVYGIACDPYNEDAINRLYAAKSRDRLKALPLLLSDASMVGRVARTIPECAKQLGVRFWPGALTLVLPRVPDLPTALGGGDTIAVRVPNHAELQAFLGSCRGALATSSANLSGRPDALAAQQAADYLGEHVGIIIDGGTTPGGIPSTVIDCTQDPPVILRVGAITKEAIQRTLSTERRLDV
jgi:L-threonylcarbamoyladenylate synthase